MATNEQNMGLEDRIRQSAARVGGLKRLAELIEVPRRTLGNWLTGTTPKPDHLRRIAQEAEVDLNWLISGEGSRENAEFHKAMERLAAVGGNPGGMSNVEFENYAERLFTEAMSKVSGQASPERVSQNQGIDVVLLQRLGDVVLTVFVECKQKPPQRAITREAGNLYNELQQLVSDWTDNEVVEALIPIVRERFKKRLLSAADAPGTGKRSA